MNFNLVSAYNPTGDQPEAIDKIVQSVTVEDNSGTTLLGVTGSGKTFTIANAIAKINKPTLVISHNKTLAAQLFSEFKNFFPENAVEYFVSYYDYYQPEAYLPTTDTYIEKDLSINDDIEKMRLKTVATLLSGRRDVIVVASVSCIYGCGNPEDFHSTSIKLSVGQRYMRKDLLIQLVNALYTRSDNALQPSTFRVTGDTIDIMSSFGEFGDQCFRVVFFDTEIEAIYTIDPATGGRLESLDSVTIYPCNLFVSTREHIVRALDQIREDLGKQIAFFEREGREMEAQRIKQRVEYDLEMIEELGYCSGIENYSRYLDGREPGSRPFCLMDFFPDDFITVIDESHVSIPQIRGMFGGDRARKENLVEYGFRLPAALDNRPLMFPEFEKMAQKVIYVSATPTNYEISASNGEVVEQLIRPTFVVDPALNVRPSQQQIDDILDTLNHTIKRGNKALITTITKAMSEEMSRFLDNVGVKNAYLHSDIDTLDRVKILDDLREGRIDVIVGVNLLREGIDLPDVSLAIILDADKEGFLRDVRSITQISGRAARNERGLAILYGDNVTDTMRRALIESNRRRAKQIAYNYEHGTLPRSARRSGTGQSPLLSESYNDERDGIKLDRHLYRSIESPTIVAESLSAYSTNNSTAIEESIDKLISEARKAMEEAAKQLDFQSAAKHRDRMYELQKIKDNSKGH